jgi:hypothetical protein
MRLTLKKEKVLGRLDKPGEVYYYFGDTGGLGGNSSNQRRYPQSEAGGLLYRSVSHD